MSRPASLGRGGAAGWALGAAGLAACGGGAPVDDVAPTLVFAEVTPAVAGPVGTVRAIFETSEPLASAAVTLEAGSGSVALHQVEGDGTYWIFSVQLSGDEPEGDARVVADLTDEQGVVAADVGLGRVTLDFTAPLLVAAELSGSHWVRAGSLAVVTVLASEPLAPTTEVAFVAPGTDLDGVTLAATLSPGSLPGWRYTVTGSEPQGPSELQLTLVDGAGNSTDAGVIAGFVFDFTAPSLAAETAPTVSPATASLAGGDRVLGTLVADELLDRVDGTFRPAGGGAGTPMTASSEDGITWSLERQVGAYPPFGAGVWEVAAVLYDPAGHRVEVLLGTVELVD